MSANAVKRALREHANDEKTAFFPRFFKTGKGEYGEGDRFLGVVVPDQRRIAKQFRQLSLEDIAKLLDDPIHECRLTGILILVSQYECADPMQRQRLVDFYVGSREMGKQDGGELIRFLDRYASKMPRTMLRYAIEKLPPDVRRDYLDKQ